MRRIREILRLQAEGYSEREIARSLGCARSSVQICLWRAERAGISWPVPAEIDDAGLDARLYPRRPGIEVQPPRILSGSSANCGANTSPVGSCGASTWRSTLKGSNTPPSA